jgi:hypothetical protein
VKKGVVVGVCVIRLLPDTPTFEPATSQYNSYNRRKP